MKNFGLAVIAFVLTTQLIWGCGKKEETHPPHPSSASEIKTNNLAEVEALEKIIAKDPKNLRANIMLGNIYFDTGRNEEAVKAYRVALQVAPDNPDLRTDMGICLRRLGRVDEAIEEFRMASKSDPGHYQSRYNLGLTLLNDKKDLGGAIEAWEELLRAVPEFPGRDKLSRQIEMLKGTRASPGSSGFGELNRKGNR